MPQVIERFGEWFSFTISRKKSGSDGHQSQEVFSQSRLRSLFKQLMPSLELLEPA